MLRAVKTLPDSSQDTYGKWRARLDKTPGNLGKLLLALSFQYSAWRTRAEVLGRPFIDPRLLAVPLLAPVVWNIYTTFLGIQILFDLPRNPNINPGQFTFGIIVTFIIIGVVISSSLVFAVKSNDLPTPLLRGVWLAAAWFNLFASWAGTKRLILYIDDNAWTKFIILAITALTVLATAFFGRLLFGKDLRSKPA